MTDPVTEIRALLMQFEKGGLKDMYIRSKDWAVFMAQPGGEANPLQQSVGMQQVATANVSVSAPHLGLFAPVCAPGDMVSAGQVIAMIDVLGRKTEVASACAGQVTSVKFAANDLVEFGEVLAEIAAA
jgi:acetyl-CoA carboxylase biotin carboxyl carrier protein